MMSPESVSKPPPGRKEMRGKKGKIGEPSKIISPMTGRRRTGLKERAFDGAPEVASQRGVLSLPKSAATGSD